MSANRPAICFCSQKRELGQGNNDENCRRSYRRSHVHAFVSLVSVASGELSHELPNSLILLARPARFRTHDLCLRRQGSRELAMLHLRRGPRSCAFVSAICVSGPELQTTSNECTISCEIGRSTASFVKIIAAQKSGLFARGTAASRPEYHIMFSAQTASAQSPRERP